MCDLFVYFLSLDKLWNMACNTEEHFLVVARKYWDRTTQTLFSLQKKSPDRKNDAKVIRKVLYDIQPRTQNLVRLQLELKVFSQSSYPED